jgi:hypothetical protein
VVLNDNLQIVGTIVGKTANSLTLDAVNNIASGDYVLSVKPESVQSQGVVGYHLLIDASFASNSQQEIYSINSEAVKSFM